MLLADGDEYGGRAAQGELAALGIGSGHDDAASTIAQFDDRDVLRLAAEMADPRRLAEHGSAAGRSHRAGPPPSAAARPRRSAGPSAAAISRSPRCGELELVVDTGMRSKKRLGTLAGVA